MSKQAPRLPELKAPEAPASVAPASVPETVNLLNALPWEACGAGVSTAQLGEDFYIRCRGVETMYDKARPPKEGKKLWGMFGTDGFRSILLASGRVVKLSLNLMR